MKKNRLSLIVIGLGLLFALESQAAPGWTRQTSNTTVMLGGIQFVDENTGFIAGDSSTLLKTKNGGSNWSRLTVGSNEPLMYLHAIDSNLIYIVAWNGKVWKTTNGGTTFSVVLAPFDSTNARGIYFTGPEKGFLCIGHYPSGGISRILRTRNGGMTWDTVYTTDEWLSHIHFPDAAHGYATGSSGRIAKTSDSGATWAPITLPGSMFMSGVFFLNKDTGYVGGVSGMQDSTYRYKKVFRTTDGGANWTVVDSTIAAVSLFFINNRTGYAIGGDSMRINGPFGITRNIRLMTTQNGGATWQRIDLGTNLNQNAFWFSGLTGYVTGDSGTIFKYQDALPTTNNTSSKHGPLLSLDRVELRPDRLQTRYSLPYDQAGQVTFSLLTTNGICLWKAKIASVGGSHIADFPMPSSVAVGLYVVKISSRDTRTGTIATVSKTTIVLP